ncbi:MAG TPA: FtsX-like permease family protein [Gammaproteobacteria bacterium]
MAAAADADEIGSNGSGPADDRTAWPRDRDRARRARRQLVHGRRRRSLREAREHDRGPRPTDGLLPLRTDAATRRRAHAAHEHPAAARRGRRACRHRAARPGRRGLRRDADGRPRRAIPRAAAHADGIDRNVAALAFLLAVIGIYGVLASTVTQRVGEIGVRMALGAGRGDVERLVVGQGARMIVAGLALGAGSAVLLGRVLSARIEYVGSLDSAC